MKKLVECVPNFSEGRRPDVLDAIVRDAVDVPGVFLLDKEMDADHHRAVVTIAGEPQAAQEAAFRMIKTASELIDLTRHSGEHPRMGATDVVPFIPLENMSTDECVALARELGQRVGDDLHIPVFLYEDAATRPERKNLAKVRKGQFEGLREEIGTNPDRTPDYGPNAIHPTAGATAIGARFFLVAYNVNLDSQDLALAKQIARTIRESSGGLPCVKAMGFELADRKLVQISMNMVNYTVTSLAAVFTAISEEARKAGVNVLESEIVGLVPREALTVAAQELLKIREFSPSQIVENRVEQVVGEQQAGEETFLTALASAEPTPGGGSASALAGALGGALTSMVCKLTVNNEKFQDAAAELQGIQEQAQRLQTRLNTLIEEDSQAYKTVLAAFRRPKTTDDEKVERRQAIQTAFKGAADTPLETMKAALEVLKLTQTAAKKGNPNAITDIGCAVHLAKAALDGAALNVKINLSSIKDEEWTTRIRAEVSQLQTLADTLAQQVLANVESNMNA